jgi:hypothetical protein
MQFPALKLARWTMCVVFLFRFGRIVQDLDDEWVLLSFTHTHTHTNEDMPLSHSSLAMCFERGIFSPFQTAMTYGVC